MKIEPIKLDGLKTGSLAERTSKVNRDMFGAVWTRGGSMSRFLQSLPRILAAEDLREISARIVTAVGNGRTVLLGMGAHPIKVGLSPIIINLMERGVLKGIAMNGACIIHDSETAIMGRTSEDVAAGLADGGFGMAEETAVFINGAVRDGFAAGRGIGRAVGQALLDRNAPYVADSILAQAARLDVVVTVHVAVGTDIVHFHPSFDPQATGGASHLDFRTFCTLVAGLKEGVFINLGSAVIIPEVFLKALTVVHNLGHDASGFTTVNMDFNRHYRPLTNVVQRPTMESGKGYHITGHHEIMFPLLAATVIEGLE